MIGQVSNIAQMLFLQSPCFAKKRFSTFKSFSQYYTYYIILSRKMSRLFLGNLPQSIEARDIERHFRGFGEIVDVVLKANFGFIVSTKHRSNAKTLIKC